MNRHDVATLLGAAAAIDPTIPAPGRQVLDMWTAMLDDIPAHIGQSALRAYYRSDHYATTHRTITPGDIVTHWRRTRREQTDRAALDETHARRQAIDNAPQPARSLAELYAIHQANRHDTDPNHAAQHAATRRAALKNTCSHCHARPGEQCTTYNGKPLRKAQIHPTRHNPTHTINM